MQLDIWAQRWNISHEALSELRKLFGAATDATVYTESVLSEAAMVNLVRLEASRKGCRLWRNNVGATYTAEGSFLRYGLANESSNVNSKFKSADLIGIRPVTVTLRDIGRTIGQFISREVKASGWRYAATEREVAQLRWAELIMAFGGDACFVNSEGTL
jgi:hypothetical protein